MVEQVVVGIDVSKAKLDVALLPGGEQFTVSNDRHGIGELRRRLSPLAPSRVVLEATGKLEQLAVSELAAAGLAVVVINPAQVRHYATPQELTKPMEEIDLADLGFEEGGYLMVKHALRRLGPGAELRVAGSTPEPSD